MSFKQRYANWLTALESFDSSKFCKNFEVGTERVVSYSQSPASLSFLREATSFQKMYLKMGLNDPEYQEGKLNYAPFFEFLEEGDTEGKNLEIEPSLSKIPGVTNGVIHGVKDPVGIVITREFAQDLMNHWLSLNCAGISNAFVKGGQEETFLRYFYIEDKANPILAKAMKYIYEQGYNNDFTLLDFHLAIKEKKGKCAEEHPFLFSAVLELGFKTQATTEAVFNKLMELQREAGPNDCNPIVPTESPWDNRIFYQYIRPCPPFCNSL